MLRRPIVMQPLGNMNSRFKPQRVASSSCPKPPTPTDGAVTSLADDYAMEMDGHWSGAEKHVVELMTSDAITYDQAEQALVEIWDG